MVERVVFHKLSRFVAADAVAADVRRRTFTSPDFRLLTSAATNFRRVLERYCMVGRWFLIRATPAAVRESLRPRASCAPQNAPASVLATRQKLFPETIRSPRPRTLSPPPVAG